MSLRGRSRNWWWWVGSFDWEYYKGERTRRPYSKLLGDLTIVPRDPFQLNRTIVEILQISTHPGMNRQLMNLKDILLASEIMSSMMLCWERTTNEVWSSSRSISAAMITSWKIEFFPNNVVKTSRTSVPSNKEFTLSIALFDFKVYHEFAKFFYLELALSSIWSAICFCRTTKSWKTLKDFVCKICMCHSKF